MGVAKGVLHRPDGSIRVQLTVPVVHFEGTVSPLEDYARRELLRFLQVVFAVDTTGKREVETRQLPEFLLAVPSAAHPWSTLFARLGITDLHAQEYVVQTVQRNGKPAVLLCGGSDAALLWAVYELAEFWGVRFLLTPEVLPRPRRAIELPTTPIRRRPLIPLRAWRGLNQLPHSGAHWGLSDYQELVDQLAKQRFNCFYVMLPAYGPFVDFEWCGLRRYTAELDFGWRLPIDEQTIGREKFNGSLWFENPDIPFESSYGQKIAAASTLLDGIRRHARSRGMSFAARFVFTEFPEEFKEHLRKLSLQDGFVPSNVKTGYVYRLGMMREGLDPTYSPFMSIRNPRFVDLAGTQLRAYLNRYGDSEYLVLHPPEFANAEADADFAWSQLAQEYSLGPIKNLNYLVSDALERLKGDPHSVMPRRLEQQIRGHICSLYLLNELLHKRDMAKLYQNSGARLIVGVPFSTLAALTAQVLGADVGLMQLLGSGYLASDAARHADELKRSDDQSNPVHLTISIEDDNIGLARQLAAAGVG